MTEADIKDAIARHDVRNAELMEILRSKGANTNDRYRPEHHFWAYSEGDASALAAKLTELGYQILTLRSGHDDDGLKYWNIEASLERSLDEAASHELTEDLVRLAASVDAEYDGWGVSI